MLPECQEKIKKLSIDNEKEGEVDISSSNGWTPKRGLV
jgi:hypothetical protein